MVVVGVVTVVVSVVVVGVVTVEVSVVVLVAVVVLVSVVVDVLGGRVVVEVTVVVDTMSRVNVAEAELPPASVANTVCVPGVPAGTLNMHENAPFESVVTVGGVVDWIVPSYLMVMLLLGANPVPVTVTAVPGVPVSGLREIELVTWNTACEIIAPIEMTWT